MKAANRGFSRNAPATSPLTKENGPIMTLANRMRMASAALFLCAAASSDAAGTQIGTLTCTSLPARTNASADVKLSCAYKGRSGNRFQFAGTVLRKGDSTVPPGKRVFIWSVLSRRPVSSNADLAGSYIGRTGRSSSGVLSRKSGASVLLKPPVGSSQLGENSSISVLRLSLKPVRV